MTLEEAWDDLTLRMCDACIAKVELDPHMAVADLCDRCRKRIMEALFSVAEDYES